MKLMPVGMPSYVSCALICDGTIEGRRLAVEETVEENEDEESAHV
jgi:hypothetical protein